ncbi:hypothetical protein [Umezawaea beigongshangensis]|uniref:hypothetical protein n=1 Tax=Umezawaea beigongshangensis TaxID=2780383 RepID=UPI0018F1BCD1|nr:hypothetical protein [Umezawaea beigongshangensis]
MTGESGERTAGPVPVGEIVGGWLRSWDRDALLGYVLVLAPVLVGLVKLLSFARWDPDNVRVVARTLDLASITTIVVLPVLPLLLLVVAAFVLNRLLVGGAGNRALAAVAAAFALVAFFAVPPLHFSAVLLELLWFTTVVVARRRGEDSTDHGAPLIRVAGAALVVLALSLTTTAAWLPSEVIIRADGTRDIGYVLEAGDHDLTMMNARTGTAEILRQDDVRKRVLCRAGSHPAIDLLTKNTAFGHVVHGSPQRFTTCFELSRTDS